MPVGGPSFSKVRKAREAIREHAEELYQEYRAVARHAVAKGDFETAEKVYRYLLDHITDDDGSSLMSPSVDKPKQIEGGTKGPAITIGVAIGGLGQKQLPAVEVIDVKPEPHSDQ